MIKLGEYIDKKQIHSYVLAVLLILDCIKIIATKKKK